MSFQNTHFVQEFIPNYTVKSEYLPTNRVVDSNQTQTAEWVSSLFYTFSYEDMKSKREQERFSLKDQLNLTQIDMSQSGPMRM